MPTCTPQFSGLRAAALLVFLGTLTPHRLPRTRRRLRTRTAIPFSPLVPRLHPAAARTRSVTYFYSRARV